VRSVGDAYRYTLQPIYRDVDRSFRCHLRPLSAPLILYQLWFYVSVPGTGFETDRLYTPVSPHDIGSATADAAGAGRRDILVLKFILVLVLVLQAIIFIFILL